MNITSWRRHPTLDCWAAHYVLGRGDFPPAPAATVVPTTIEGQTIWLWQAYAPPTVDELVARKWEPPSAVMNGSCAAWDTAMAIAAKYLLDVYKAHQPVWMGGDEPEAPSVVASGDVDALRARWRR